MFEVTLLCSDRDCAEISEVLVETLSEIDGLGCECGYGSVVLRVTEVALV
jgi:hypothetical protein